MTAYGTKRIRQRLQQQAIFPTIRATAEFNVNTGYAQGDAIKTSDAAVNQIKIANANMQGSWVANMQSYFRLITGVAAGLNHLWYKEMVNSMS